MPGKIILVTGATGYIASRLIPLLLEQGYIVRCLARQPERLKFRPWVGRVEVIPGDLTRPESLPAALQGVDAAYYLVHSMAAGHGYHELDLQAARGFSAAAKQAGVGHIIYVGGLANPDENLALHLRSRIETGQALAEAGVPVTEFRAGVIVGPGSVSFEMIRFIAEQFPVMVGPTWLRRRSQPVAASDILAYLLAALNTPACQGKVIELGCERPRQYIDVMAEYAQIRGLRRASLLLPFIPPALMAFFIDKLTPVEYAYALPLVEGLQNDSLVRDRAPLGLFPGIQPLDYAEAVRRALQELHPDFIQRLWLDVDKEHVFMKHEGFLVDYRRQKRNEPAQQVFERLARMGGRNPWPGADGLFRLRGWIDLLIGGPGLRGSPPEIHINSEVDYYRVEDIQPGRRLLLKSELKAPAQGWMEWQVTPLGEGCLLEQTAYVAPKGLPGYLYWLMHLPFHAHVFHAIIRAI